MRKHAALVLILLGLAGCGIPKKGDESQPAGREAQPAQTSSANTMPLNAKHAELLEIARRIKNSEERFFGEVPLRELEAADTTAMTDEQKAQHDYELGMQMFRLGHEREAVPLLERSSARRPNVTTSFMLGVAELRTGELDNCCNKHNAESCTVPLQGGGIHVNRSGAEMAQTTFLKILENCPEDMWPQTRWFANLAAMANGTWPQGLPDKVRIGTKKFEENASFPRFHDVAIEKGVAVFNLAGGTAMDDFNGDGFLDLVMTTADIEGQMRYFENRGNGTFAERTEEAGLMGQLGGLNFVHADYDGDGDLDILVLRGGWMGPAGRMPKSLLRNAGDGTFTDVTKEAGLDGARFPGQTADFADYDLDGDLDLYIGSEMPKPEAKLDFPCQLYRNEGDGTFVEVGKTAGVDNLRFAKGVAWGDYDGDRYPDLYVSNHFMLNRLYHNNRDGTFTDVAEKLHVTLPEMSFPVWFWDYDNDSRLDIFVGGYGGDLKTFVKSFLRPSPEYGLHTIYRNEGGTFRDVSKEAGLTVQSLAMGANFGDLDNDGYLDFYLGTGSPEFDSLMPKMMYRNDGQGHFQDVTFAGGFGNLQKGHGISFGDIDNDGDQDVFIDLGGIYPYDDYYSCLYENPGFGAHWITLSFAGVKSNRSAVGTRVHVRIDENGKPRDIYRWVGASGSFGGSSLQQEIGLGKASKIVFVEVYWPLSDTTQKFDDLEMDSFYKIQEFEKKAERLTRAAFPLS